MTNLAEAKLARESEIALATLAMVTDYDCWHEEDVNVETVISHLKANSANAKEILRKAIPQIPTEVSWPEHRSLESAVMTPAEYWPEQTKKNLQPMLQRFMNGTS